MQGHHTLLCTVLLIQLTEEVFYLPMETELTYRWTKGQTICEDHGMSLPIVRTETDFDNLVVIKNNIAESLGKDQEEVQVWLGLTHDGSTEMTIDHFTWVDGNQPTYVRVHNLDLAKADNNTDVTCVRLVADNMRITNCEWKRNVFCQGSFQSYSTNSPTIYVKNNVFNDTAKTTTTQFVPTFNDSQLPVQLSMRRVGSPSIDTADCFLSCAQQFTCQFVAVLFDKSACFIQI